MVNEVQKAILERRSTRGFSDICLTEEELAFLRDAALAAPSAVNFQDWHFTFVTNRELMTEFDDDYREVLLEGKTEEQKKALEDYKVFFNAPLLVLVTLPEQPRSRFAQVDAGIAVQNLALSAQGMGLGSVIVGRPIDVFAGEKGEQWEKKFGFPSGHHFAIGIVIGHNTVTKEAHPIGEDKITMLR